jgi:hypothetical protein
MVAVRNHWTDSGESTSDCSRKARVPKKRASPKGNRSLLHLADFAERLCRPKAVDRTLSGTPVKDAISGTL